MKMRIKLLLPLFVYLQTISTEASNATGPAVLNAVKIDVKLGSLSRPAAKIAAQPSTDRTMERRGPEKANRIQQFPKEMLRTFQPEVAVLYPGFTKLRDTDQPCSLCQDLLKPMLKSQSPRVGTCRGRVENLAVMHKISNLLRVEVTENSLPTEIYNIVYQLSRMEFRLFLWPPQNIALMFQALFEQAQMKHFPNWFLIKQAIWILFEKYKLDLSQPDVLLKHSRIFRPACLTYPYTGSTKLNRYVTLTPRSPSKKQCNDTNECHDRW